MIEEDDLILEALRTFAAELLKHYTGKFNEDGFTARLLDEYALWLTNYIVAQLHTDLRDAVEIINRVGDSIGADCPICTGGINKWGHVQACYDLQTWANRPSVKAAVEEKG